MLDDALPLTAILLCQLLPLALGAAILVAAALHDVAARTIPNWTCIALAILGLLLRWADGQLIAGVLLGLTVFAAAAFCWRRGWLGGGDVKLLAAAAVFVPPHGVGNMLCDTALAGGLVALVYLVSRRLLRNDAEAPMAARRALPKRLRIFHAERRRLRRGGPLPYGSAIACGTIFVLITG